MPAKPKPVADAFAADVDRLKLSLGGKTWSVSFGTTAIEKECRALHQKHGDALIGLLKPWVGSSVSSAALDAIKKALR